MKKRFGCLLAACLVLWAFAGLSPRAKAAEHRDHCVCGGSAVDVHDHKCEAIEWKPLSDVVTLNAVNWENVPSGHYYLDGDVTVTSVTDGNCIGKITKQADGTYTPDDARTVNICLNGHNITTTQDRVFKGIYMNSLLSVCDCSGEPVDGIWSWNGTVTGGTSNNGGIFYTYANSRVDIYGGNFTGKADRVAKGGGLFYVAQDRAAVGDTTGKENADYASTLNIYNGNIYGGETSANGGNIYVAHYSSLHVYGGYIHDGTAANKGGNIYFGGNSTVTTSNALIYGGLPEAVHVVNVKEGREVLSQGYTLAEALKHVSQGSYLKLTRDLTETVTLNKDVLLDLNGCDLSGVTVSGKLTCFDSKTDSYEGDQAGVLSCDGNARAKENYLAISTEAGVSFHRYGVEITHLSLKPANVAMGYKAKFEGDRAVGENVAAFGYELWLEGYEPRTYSSKEFVSGKELTLRLQNILSRDNTPEENKANAEKEIFAKAFIVLNDGTKVSCDPVCYDLKEMLELADDGYAGYNSAQQTALQTLAGKFSETMMTWDVEHFHHATGGMWTKVNQSGFIAKLTKDESYYKITPGSYVLTADVDIGTRTLKIASDTTVNICLNGHTITGSKRMMRVYGTLNLCDCHDHGEAEGSMVSSFTSDTGHGAVFYTYYGSTFNLYGGNLKATGTLQSSGVGAVSHEDQDDHPDIPPGVMNMYGGTLSGGTTTGNGGLLALYHGGSFYMYGGELYNGNAGGHGGAISVSGSSQVGLYGGRIYDCHSYVITDGQKETKVDGVYMDKGQLTLSGDVEIDHVYLPYTARMNGDNMTAGARIGLVSDVHGFLSDNTALADCFILEEGYTPKVINGKLVAVKTGVTETAQTGGFRVGYSSVCINPAQETGIPLSGFGNSADRTSTEIQEDIYASATAITDGDGNTVLLITCDLQRPQEAITDVIREHVSLATGVPFENVIISASHSHSTPDLYSGNALIKEYKLLLYNNFTQAAIEAMASRVPATVQAGVVEEVKDPKSGKYMNFTRHYVYIDSAGNAQYHGDNFGTAPGTAAEKATWKHVAQGDHSMQLIRFVRDSDKDVILCNFAAHPTMTGGADKTVLSADYVGPLRDKVQGETDCYFAFVQGAAGNMNTTSRIGGETPYTKEKYHDYGEALAQVVLDHINALETVETGKVQTRQYDYEATVYKHTEEELAKAQQFNALSYEERKAAYKDWGYTSIYHASSIIAKHNLGEKEKLELNVFSIGDALGFYTLPGELWAESGMAVKEASPFAYTFTVGYTNGDWKYFTGGAAADGTYESYEGFYTRFVAPDTTNDMIAWWQAALKDLYEAL